MANQASAQIEADKRLINYANYDDYLKSMNTTQDECYLQDDEHAKLLSELGYRNPGETLSKDQFEKRKSAVYEYLFPSFKPYELASDGMKHGTQIQQELALRERSNRVGILSTIIHVRVYKEGWEISSYIDYGQRLTEEDWKPFFHGHKRLIPKEGDLSFYHWKTQKVVSKNSVNYIVKYDPVEGLLFTNRFDRMTIHPSPTSLPGNNTFRKRVHSKGYELIILFDHVVRQRI